MLHSDNVVRMGLLSFSEASFCFRLHKPESGVGDKAGADNDEDNPQTMVAVLGFL